MIQADDPPFLTVGTEVSAKYKGAFCEAKISKVVKIVKVKVNFKFGFGSAVLLDDAIKGALKIGAHVKANHPDKGQQLDGIITKIQDCSQYTVVFDDGDITTLRRSSLCLKSGRHFAESETLDQLPLTHPEHFGTPVVGGSRRGRRSRHHNDSEEDSTDEESEEINVRKRHRSERQEWECDIGKVVCVEIGDKKKARDNWFPGLVVAPTAQDSVKIESKKDFLVRSFQDGRYYTVPKKEAKHFNREVGSRVTQTGLRTAVDKALQYIDKDELPPHWDRDLLFGVDVSDLDFDRAWESDTSDDEPREEKDHFVAQLYKFMEECGTPINKGPTVGSKDLDLYKLFKVVQKLGGYNRVMNQNQWKIVSVKMNLQSLGSQSGTLVKSAYKRYLQSFDDFYRKLGCTMVSSPRGSNARQRSGRSLIRVCDKRPSRRADGETDSAEDTDKKEGEGDTEEDEKTEEEDEKKKGVLQSCSLPVRTMSPTTRDKQPLRESARTTRKESRLRHLSGKVSSRESSKESLRESEQTVSKTAQHSAVKPEQSATKTEQVVAKTEQTAVVKVEPKEEVKKSRVEEIKRRAAAKLDSESEGEVDETKTKTRSLRNREERDKELDSTKKPVDKKLRQETHQRSASCNSTSSGTSCTSTCTSSSTNNHTDNANKAGNRAVKPKSLTTQTSVEDLRKRGRKRRVESSERELMSIGKSLLPSHVPICIGDRLKVLYGPNNKESKVTYEAKVLEVEEASLQKMYYVHYSGWNSRYDEWVVRQRVAQNVTWSQSRSKKCRSVSKDVDKDKPELKEEEKKDKDKVVVPTPFLPRSLQVNKRGKPNRLSRSDSASSTRSSIKNEKVTLTQTRSSSTSLNVDKSERRRSTRASLTSGFNRDTEESGSDLSDSGIRTLESAEKELDRKTSDSCPPSGAEEKAVEAESKEKPSLSVKEKEIEDEELCGKDIDLKAIESEMKGLGHPVKKPESVGSNVKEITGRMVTFIPASLTITERKKHDPKKPFDSPIKKTEIPVKLVPAQEIMGQIKPLALPEVKKEPFMEDDVYEFKEPEPFEFSDIRSRKDGKCKTPETENEAKGKKRSRAKKDSDEGDSDIPTSTTPQKRSTPLRESPSKRIDLKESPPKREVRDYTRKVNEPTKIEEKVVESSDVNIDPPVIHIKEFPLPEGAVDGSNVMDYFTKDQIFHQLPIDMKDYKFEDLDHSKDSHFLSSGVVITPKKMVNKKETVITESVAITPSKDIKPEDSSKNISPVLVDGSVCCKVRPMSIPVPVSVPLERPLHFSHMLPRAPTPGHVMAQVVMPPVDSRVIPKSTAKQPLDYERAPITSSTHSVPPALTIKTDEKTDGKVIPFSKRQQHIFPHLLNRPDAEEVTIQRTSVIKSYSTKLTENPILDPPVISLPEDPCISLPTDDLKDCNPTDVDKESLDKSRSDKAIEESIEAVILRATQDKPDGDKNESPKLDKRRRNPGRTKKLSRELIPDTSEDSDAESTKSDKIDQRPKRRVGDGTKHSPAKKPVRNMDANKKAAQKLDEEDRANDADEEDNEGNFFSRNVNQKEVQPPRRRKTTDDEIAPQKDIRTLKKKRKIGLSRRTDDGEEIELGDLLCKEIIPPGSPMPQEHLAHQDSGSPIHQPSALKQELPFASVPAGSSFSKRITSSHANLPSSLQMSLQQLHPSVCIQTVSKSSSATHPVSSLIPCTSSNQPDVTITSITPNSQPSSIADIKDSLMLKTPLTIPGGAKLIPTKPQVETSPKVDPKSSLGSSSLSDISSNAVNVDIVPSSRPAVPPKCETSKVSPTGKTNSSLPSVDHTPPTTPESLTSTLSDSPRRSETDKYDDSSKTRSQYSPELESDAKIGNCSEDSNTMDSNTSGAKLRSQKHGPILPSRLPVPNSQSEGWDTEDGYPVPQKRRKKGSRTPRSGPMGDDEKESPPPNPSSGKKRRRRHSSRGSAKADEECDVAHGLNTLSMAALHSSRGRVKYNFCQDIDPDLDATRRITLLQNRMQELRRTYMHIKSELSSVERRRKKLRKKEKEVHVDSAN